MRITKISFLFALLVLCTWTASADLLQKADAAGNESRKLILQAKALMKKGDNSQARTKAYRAVQKAKEALGLIKRYETDARHLQSRSKNARNHAYGDIKSANDDVVHELADRRRAKVDLAQAANDLRKAELSKKDAQYDIYLATIELNKLIATRNTDNVTTSRMAVLRTRIKNANTTITRQNLLLVKAEQMIHLHSSEQAAAKRDQGFAERDRMEARRDHSDADREQAQAKKMLSHIGSARSRYNGYLSQANSLRNKAN